jgi:biopolymer transport protein ExbB
MEMIQGFYTFMVEGGSIMWVILLIFFMGMGVALERLFRLRSYDLNSSSFMNEIQKLVLAHKIKDAIQYCSGSKALTARVIKNGLKRSNQGIEQVQNAIDATALEVVPLVETRMHWLSFYASVSTLFGLLGTIFGLIDSFKAVGIADPSKKAQILSAGISVAMNTTALGLLAAIGIMFIHSILTSKSEKILSDIDQYAVKLIDLLGTMKVSKKDGIITNEDLT